MNIYTNGFRCSLKNDEQEFLVQFLQGSPKYNEDDEIIGTETEVVASVVMTLDNATALAKLIEDCASKTLREKQA